MHPRSDVWHEPGELMFLMKLSPVLPALLAAACIALAPGSAAAAATYQVTMDDSRTFQPISLSVPPGGIVRWRVSPSASPAAQHDVRSSRPNGYFQSPGNPGSMHAGSTYSFSVDSAGTFRYQCVAHASDSMTGTLVVPIGLSRLGGSPERFRVSIGSVALPTSSPWVRIVQVDPPGGGVNWKTISTTRAAAIRYTPTARGSYRFQALLKSTASEAISDPSPPKSISH